MINGVLNIYKEAGFTSHDVVGKLRGMVKQKKIGHTGTLDPAAEGVLPLCLGNATKVCELLTDWDKTYEAVLLLGRTTDTQDTTGLTLKECPVKASEAQVEAAVGSFLGAYDQVPPMYSALKVDGKKLYELAREGKVVERKSRPVRIFQLEILKMELPRVWLRVACSKGTYIRTLCHDIGESLGCGGCMEKLLRTRVGLFSLEDSLRLSKLQALQEEGRLLEQLIPVDRLFPLLKQVVLRETGDKLVYNGNPFPEEYIREWRKPQEKGDFSETAERIQGQKALHIGAAGRKKVAFKEGEQDLQVLVYDSVERFVGIYRYVPGEKRYRPVKMFLERDGQT